MVLTISDFGNPGSNPSVFEIRVFSVSIIETKAGQWIYDDQALKSLSFSVVIFIHLLSGFSLCILLKLSRCISLLLPQFIHTRIYAL
jgi:hypothetical protein